MLRLTSLLLALGAALYTTMLIGGRDHGQTRPGLASLAAPEAPTVMSPRPRPATWLHQAAFTPEPELAKSNLPVVLPLVPRPTPEPVPAAAVPEPAPEPDSPGDVRHVTARAVNVRQGPSTSHPVIGRLTRGEAALVIEAENGWARILIEGDGIEGYVSDSLLSAAAP